MSDQFTTLDAARSRRAASRPVPPLPEGFLWAAVAPADHEPTAATRHVVHEHSTMSLCGILTLPRLWKVNRSRPHCLDCLGIIGTRDLDDFEITKRLTIQRVRTVTGGQATKVTDHVAAADAPRRTLARYFDADIAAALDTLRQAGMLRLAEQSVGADRDGIYETVDGDSIRGHDPATDRQVSRLVITTGFIEADGTPYAPGSDRTATGDAGPGSEPAEREWEPEDAEF